MKGLILLTISVLFAATAGANEPLTLSGSVDGYETRNYDDKLDFGLVIPTLSKEQIMDFSLSSVLSTEIDKIRAAGQTIKVPSNVSLPNQRERYFITIRINKPAFRLPVHFDDLPESVAVLEGHMPFTDTVDTLRSGAPLFSVINSFTFKSYSLTPVTELEDDLELTAGENPIDGETVTFDVPVDTDPEYVSIGLNLNSTINDAGETKYFPINLKTLERPQNLMNHGENNTPVIVSIPKSTFDSELDETAGLPFPFSLVWGESQPEIMLPLAKDFVTFTSNGVNQWISVDNAKLEEFNILSFKLTTYDSDGAIIADNSYDTFEGDIGWSADSGVTRVRLDVLATDPDPVLESINSEYMLDEDVFSKAKYITRYEEDIN